MALMFNEFADICEKIEKITSGNLIRSIISGFLKKVSKKDIDEVCYLLLGQIASEYEDVNLGMADKMVVKAIAVAGGRDKKEVLSIFKKTGDAGETALKVIGRAKRKISLKEVFLILHKIAKTKGSGSQEAKIKLLAEILKQSSPKESKYICRIALGTMRLGIGDMTILDALAIAFTGSKKNKKELEHAYNICPDIGIIAKTIATKGLKRVAKTNVMIGRPIQMMLAQRVKKITEIQEKMYDEIAVEEKYDGERIQVHKKGDKIVLYSRRLENITHQFPDVIEAAKKNLKAKDCIIEGEIVPVDPKGKLLPFQILMRRRRKYEIEKYAKKIPTCFYVFDLLFANGKSYIHRKYPERRRMLEKVVRDDKKIQLAKQTRCTEIDCVEDFFNRSLERGCEGIIAKSCSPDSVYQAGTRGWLWIKWKKEYVKELTDTFDLVVVGAFMGKGRRSGAYGALLCATYNSEKDRFETFCKLGTGFKDKDLAEFHSKFKKYVVDKKPARVELNRNMKPDALFEPAIVVEVLGAEITKSPMHTCANGLALRFPRFIRYREDKKPEQATTTREAMQIYGKKR